MFTYQASIGRNTIGGDPLRKEDWVRFVNAVNDVMSILSEGTDKPEIHFGTGTWDGITEDSAFITVRTEIAASDYAIRNVRDFLATDAFIYGQAAIGFTVGQSDLVIPYTAR